MKKMFLISLLLSALPYSTNAKDFSIASPDGKLVATVTVNGKITYRLFHQSDLLIESSPIAMKLVSGEVWDYNPQIEKSGKEGLKRLITKGTSRITREIATPAIIGGKVLLDSISRPPGAPEENAVTNRLLLNCCASRMSLFDAIRAPPTQS